MVDFVVAFLKMFGLAFLQNASFTLVSRARNSTSLKFNFTASVLSNAIFILVLKDISNNDNNMINLGYILGGAIGNVAMQYISMKYIEKNGEDSKSLQKT